MKRKNNKRQYRVTVSTCNPIVAAGLDAVDPSDRGALIEQALNWFLPSKTGRESLALLMGDTPAPSKPAKRGRPPESSVSAGSKRVQLPSPDHEAVTPGRSALPAPLEAPRESDEAEVVRVAPSTLAEAPAPVVPAEAGTAGKDSVGTLDWNSI